MKPGADPIKLSSSFFFFGDKLGHFTINLFLLYVTNIQAFQRKMEKFFVSKEKSFIGSTPSKSREVDRGTHFLSQKFSFILFCRST